MSVNAVERILWEFGNNPELIGRFRSSPDGYLSSYHVTDEEKRALLETDLKALAEQGVSTLLTMSVWPMLNGPEGMPFAYLEHMNGGELKAPPGA
ncbi:MAG: hypothetical protein DRR42_08785 [Gammaproteobacteria bacterium]|nr:MAG: hypothetical protein DRR42_08785 [Gammaproteobacteria bacterium]